MKRYVSRLESMGDVINWELANWNASNMVSKERKENVCRNNIVKGNDLFLGEIRDLVIARKICDGFRGRLPHLESKTEQDRVYEVLKNSKLENIGGIWLAWNDRAVEGQFVSIYNMSSMLELSQYSDWDVGEPNGNENENCAVLSYKNAWNDIACSEDRIGVVCQLEEHQTFVLRGVCGRSLFDTHYALSNTKKQGAIFRGSSNSFIHYSLEDQAWKISLYSTNLTYALLSDSSYKFPLGNKRWKFVNDSCMSSMKKQNDHDFEEPTFELSFSACKISEFNCKNAFW